jgi:alpha-N-arabinofuranosidase
VVNPHVRDEREVEIAVPGATLRSCQARTITANDIHAHNSFDKPDAVRPNDSPVDASGASLVYRFAPASVTRLTLELA